MSLSLNCLIHGEVQEKMFIVEVEETKSVSILKKLIKEEKAPHLDHVAASDLVLWRVNRRLDELGVEPVHVNLDTCLTLSPPRKKLLSFFNGTVDDEHLHILAEAPVTQPVPVLDPYQLLSLNCFVLGDDLKKVFTVKIPKIDNVSILKDLIKEKKASHLNHVDASDLDIFQVSLPMDDDVGARLQNANPSLKQNFDMLGLQNEPPLFQGAKLSNVFSDEPKDEHVHIVVRPPPTLTRPSLYSEAQEVLVLNCFVLGDSINNTFPVEIARTKSVGILKKAIKTNKSPKFDHIPADQLVLWKVDITCDRSLQKTIHDLGLTDEGCLLPVTRLSDSFADLPHPENVHIVVRHPESSLDPLYTHHDDLGNRRRAWNDSLPDGPPSTLGEPSQFKIHQQSPAAFHFNRPPSAAATIPVTLNHFIFGQFVDDCKTHIPTKEDNELAFALSSGMSELYDNENDRATAFRSILREHGIIIQETFLEGTRCHTDGDMQCNHIRYLILEVKMEIGSKGAEPLFQAIWYYQRSMGGISNDNPGSSLPCLLVLLFGAHIGFAGATYTDRPNVQVLSPILPFYWHHTDLEERMTVARTLGALRNAIRLLQHYYEHDFPMINTLAPASRLDPRFPHPSSYVSLSDSTTRRFNYVKHVPRKLVFFGLTDDGEHICIKFVRSYSKEAHTICHSMGCSPALRGFKRIPGGWDMVVMDIITPDYCYADTSTPYPCQQEIEVKLVALHQAGYVHGDIRGGNLMVRKDGSLGFMLIDFDWAGEIGKVQYPINVNVNLKEDGSVKRPVGAYDGELIKAEHDIEMLHKIFRVIGS